MRFLVEVCGGFLLLIVGAILSLPGVPGPGIVIALLGLALLARHFHWARRTLDWAKRKFERVRDAVRERAGRGSSQPTE
jgi:uncharacterized protein (TIGR02611 family)